MRRKKAFIVLMLVLLVVATVTCGGGAPPTYRVTHETGLYSSLASEDPARFLAVGTTLVPAQGEEKLTCRTHTIEGIEMSLCHVEVEDTGHSGWVLEKWIEKK
jgi:hypothetical protein